MLFRSQGSPSTSTTVTPPGSAADSPAVLADHVSGSDGSSSHAEEPVQATGSPSVQSLEGAAESSPGAAHATSRIRW